MDGLGLFLYDIRITDALLTLFTFFLAVFTYQLRRATDKLWDAAKEQSRNMKSTVQTARDANTISRENMIFERRAWLSISDVKLKHPTTITEKAMTFAVSVTVKNYGQTPALNVEVRFESYFLVPNSEKFADAQGRFKAELRSHPVQWGSALIFPEEGLIQGELWTDGLEKIKGAIETRPSGERMASVIFFIGVGYRIVGDEKAHITYRPHAMLNLPMGFTVPPGELRDLPRLPNLAGEAD